MFYKIIFAIIIIYQREVISVQKNSFYYIYMQDDSYRGEKFPVEYLSTDGVTPTLEDFTYYMNNLYRVVDYLHSATKFNDTDSNIAIGSFVMKSVLKRILLDYSDKITEEDRAIIKNMIYKAEDIVSHFIVDCQLYGPEDLGHDISKLFKYDDSLVVSLGKHNKYAIQKWIMSDLRLHDYREQMDDLTLPKEFYAEIVIDMEKYYSTLDSDICIPRVGQLQIPIRKDDVLKPCRRDPFCKQRMLYMPSVAYALSHRFLYLALVSLARRCYIVSEASDRMYMDIMCANMYRETVYLARRGYFYRDLFLEHIAFCGLIGYEEFYRTWWFKKSASWINQEGCMGEFRNFEINRTRIYVSRQTTLKAKRTMKKISDTRLNEECSRHHMSLVINVLAHGMRHAAHYMKSLV